jgi:hypothetical protein
MTDCRAITSRVVTGQGKGLHTVPRRADRHPLSPRADPKWLMPLGIVLVLFGCATTQVQRGGQLGALGRTYADAVALAGQEAIASSVAFSLVEIRNERAGGAFPAPEDRSKAIEDQIEILKQRQQLVEMSNQLLGLLAEYFADLEQFAKQDISTPFEMATGGLVDSINRISDALATNPQARATVSEAEHTSLAKLSGLVAYQVHGQVLARVLERDASMIGTQLKLMSKILATYSGWIRARSNMELQEFYSNRIVKPFVGTEELSGSWDDDVRRYLQGTNLSGQLADAKSAGERMERFWAGYLAGETSIGDIAVNLKHMELLFEAVSAFSKARTDTKAAKPD